MDILRNRKNVASVIGYRPDEIKKIWEAEGLVYANLADGNTARVTEDDLYRAMQSDRILKGQSSCFKITKRFDRDYCYTVRNLINNHSYVVDAREDIITCDCPDYENQVNAVGKDKACCKHCYGLLKHLGYLSLEEYFEDMQQLKEMYEQHLIEEYYQDDNRAYYI